MLLRILIPLITLIVCIWLDVRLAQWLFNLVPMSDWTPLIKVGIAIVLIWLTSGLVISITFLVGKITAVLTK